MARQFYDAFSKVFNCTPHRLYCTWHVDKAWKEQLKEKVKITEVYFRVYKQLRTLLEQTNIDIFNRCLTTYSNTLIESNVTKAFGKYFLEQWALKKECWAYCYRVGFGINTNMFCEAFHRVFKYQYLKGKVNKRVDKCLVNLMKFNRDKAFERMIKLTKGKCSHKIKSINDRHQASLKLPFGSVQEIENGSGSGCYWSVKSEDGKRYYNIATSEEQCKETTCRLKCIECNICYHKYACTCPDFLIYSTICKHIHLVQRYRERNEPQAQSGSIMEEEEEASIDTHEKQQMDAEQDERAIIHKLLSSKQL